MAVGAARPALGSVLCRLASITMADGSVRWAAKDRLGKHAGRKGARFRPAPLKY